MEETTTVNDPRALKNRLVGHVDDYDVVEITRAGVATQSVEISSPAQLTVEEDEERLLVNPTGESLPIEVDDEVTIRSK